MSLAFPLAGGAQSLSSAPTGIKGVYGIPSVAKLGAAERTALVNSLAGIEAVFVPPDAETIRFFKGRGFKVFLTANIFGGTAAWKEFPDSRPRLADGRYLGEGGSEVGHGGVCPTHAGWRATRLKEIADWVKRFGGRDGIDGLWLDFLRYPGLWESKGMEAPLPETCYCPRCLTKFSRDTGFALPMTPEETAEAAAWLNREHPYEWMAWKKEQINSFAREVRRVIDSEKEHGSATPLLGAFVVPWTKGEKNGAVSFPLGQDAFALSEIVDVISPMLYHRMVGLDEAWVGRMTEYFTEQSRCPVWPIIQTEETSVKAFAEAVRMARLGGATGLLAFAHRDLSEGKRRALAAFSPPENLIPNPAFQARTAAPPVNASAGKTAPKKTAAKGSPAVSPWPASWSGSAEDLGKTYGPKYGIVSGDELLPPVKAASSSPAPESAREGNPQKRGSVPLFLSAKGGTETAGEWRAPLPACEPGAAYRLSLLFHRDTWNELSYSYASLWGERYLLEKHSAPRVFQALRVKPLCPPGPTEPSYFRFINEVPSDFFYLAQPELVQGLPLPAPAPAPNNGFFYPGFFPIGIYGATTEDLDEVRKVALNTVLVTGQGEALKKAVTACRRLGLHYVLSPPQDPERLRVYLDGLTELPMPVGDPLLAFYVDDEPEMRAVPMGRAADVQRLVKGRFPGAATGMATVRPSYCREYEAASDFFMIDNYPFPDMPMSWLGDAMDRAAKEVGRDRLLSVVQAFSDGGYWPSLPGWRQMDCLAFLSIVHGSRGIFFYTWSVMGKTAEGRASLGRVVGRLNRIYPWLLEKNLPTPVEVTMRSDYRLDPSGRPAVQAALKRRGDELMLIAVNTIGAPVEAELRFALPPFHPGEATEVFSGGIWPLRDGALKTALQAYETRVFIMKK